MALSKRAQEAIRRAVTDDKAAEELMAALEAAQEDEQARADAEEALARQAVAVDDIADTENASAEEVAEKMNELLAALRAADLLLE
jgi:hypothetical protein